MFKKNYFYIILTLCVVLILINIWWLKVDHRLLENESLMHFESSLRVWELFSKFSMLNLLDLANYSLHPPLIGLLVRPFYFIFGAKLDAAILIMNLIFLPLLVFSTFKIIEFLTKKQSLALLGGAILLSYPCIVIFSRFYQFELPLTAIVTTAMYFLIRSDFFSNRKFSILFGVFAGMAMLTRSFTGIFFIIGPLTYAFFNLNKKEKTINARISLILLLVITGIWYIPTVQAIPSIIKCYFWSNSALIKPVPAVVEQFKIPFVIEDIINYKISFLHFVLFCMSLVFFIRNIDRNKAIIILWLVIPYVFLILFKLSTRYLVPVAPAFAIITSIGLGYFKNRHKYILSAVLVAYSIFLLCILTWEYSAFSVDKFPLKYKNIYLLDPFAKIKQYPAHPVIEKVDWHISEFFEAMKNSNPDPHETIGIVVWHLVYSEKPLAYYARNYNMDLFFLPLVCYVGWDPIAKIEEEKIRYLIDSGDNRNPQLVEPIRKYIRDNIDSFQIIFQKQLPDNNNLVVYKLKNGIASSPGAKDSSSQ